MLLDKLIIMVNKLLKKLGFFFKKTQVFLSQNTVSVLNKNIIFNKIKKDKEILFCIEKSFFP